MTCKTTAIDYKAQAALMHVLCVCVGNYNIMHILQAAAVYLLSVN